MTGLIMNPQHKLVFGAINLIGTDAELATNGYVFESLSDDTDFGNPVPIEQKVISWLQDGALLSLSGYDNRDDMVVRIRITGTDSNKLALAEQALMLETGKSNTLTWTPPDGVGQPCVFSVIMSNLEHSMDDMAELRLQRIYTLRIQAEPFVRSQTLTTVTKAAPSGTQSITSIDTASSATNWTKTSLPTGGSTTTTAASTTGAYVFGNFSALSQAVATRVSLQRASLSTSLSGTPYIRLDLTPAPVTGDVVDLGSYSGSGPGFRLNGVVAPIAVQEGNVYWFDAGALSITTLTTVEVSMNVRGTSSSAGVTLAVNDISRSNFLGTQATNRQLARTLAVAGSARTQGSLAIADATNALGSTLIYTCPTVGGLQQPPLRTLLSSGNTTTADTSLITAVKSDTQVLHTFDVPETGLLPGGHLLLARLQSAFVGPIPVAWAARSRQGTTNLGGAQTGSTTITSASTAWATYNIATLNLPPRRIGPAGKVRIELSTNIGGAVWLDEAWLFNIETGRLTWVECGTSAPSAGGTSNRLWLDSPTVDSPVPSVWLGNASDRSDSYHAGSEMQSFGNHQFVPPSMNVFTVTSNAQAAGITLSHYPRFHTHVAA